MFRRFQLKYELGSGWFHSALEYKWILVSVTSIGVFMAGLDARIVIVGLPTIGEQLRIGVSELVWVTQVYILMITILSLLFGRIADFVGRVKIFNIGFAVFTIGSALSALSFTGTELIAARVVQGVGGAMLIGNSAAMLTDVGGKNDLGTLFGINTIVSNAGGIAGFTLSGVILSFTDWRALFYVNLPIGVFGTYWAYKKLREVSTKDAQRHVDWTGFAIFSSSLTLILLSLTFFSYGSGQYSELGFSALAAGVVLMGVFAWVETRVRTPLLDTRLFRNVHFAMGNIALITNGIPYFGMFILVSFYLQLGLGVSPLQTGLDLLPVQFTNIVGNLISGRLSDKYGRTWPFSAAGMSMMAIGMFVLGSIAATTYASPLLVVACVAFSSFGSGFFVVPNTKDVMSSVHASRRGVAAGFRATVVNISNATSYGFVVLLLTLVIPYASLTGLVQSGGIGVVTSIHTQFIQGSQVAAYLLGAIAAVGVILQFVVRSREVPQAEEIGIT